MQGNSGRNLISTGAIVAVLITNIIKHNTIVRMFAQHKKYYQLTGSIFLFVSFYSITMGCLD